jgi:type II restriction enzyme
VDLAFDRTLAEGYRSQSQVARVLSQDWVKRQLYCPSCRATDLVPTPQNTKSRDFNCGACSEPYELKSGSIPFRSRVLNGEYYTMLATIRESKTPNLLLLEYDRPAYSVRNLTAIHRNLLSTSAIVARKTSLSTFAKRSGWLGCYIDISQVPAAGRVQLVRAGIPSRPSEVRAAWHAFDFMEVMSPKRRGWLADVLSCVEAIPESTFALRGAYQFEARLGELHPQNRNIRPKIRQQLQILVREGLIERLEPGVYRRVLPRLSPKPGVES